MSRTKKIGIAVILVFLLMFLGQAAKVANAEEIAGNTIKTKIVLQPGDPWMIVNGQRKEIDPGRGTAAVIVEKWGRTVVPIRAIIEEMGGTVSWEGVEEKITIAFNNQIIELWIGKSSAKVNELLKLIDDNQDVRPIIINDRTMLPLRFVAENLGCDVEWDEGSQAITIACAIPDWHSATQIYLPLPREIDQSIESWKITSNIPTVEIVDINDEYGNRGKLLSWYGKPEVEVSEITASLEVIVSRKVEKIDFTKTSITYPIPVELIPNEVKLYLKPSFMVQSDNSEIVALAEELNEGLTRETEVVNRTIQWVSQNIKWTCSREFLNEEACGKYGYRSVGGGVFMPIDPNVKGAAWVLKYQIGVCSDFANLTIALLRAQGIPARYVIGKTTNPDNLTILEADAGHAWVQVYYPSVGWIDHDPTKGMTFLPSHIVFKVLPDETDDCGFGDGGEEKWQVTGLGNNRVKMIYSVTVSRK